MPRINGPATRWAKIGSLAMNRTYAVRLPGAKSDEDEVEVADVVGRHDGRARGRDVLAALDTTAGGPTP